MNSYEYPWNTNIKKKVSGLDGSDDIRLEPFELHVPASCKSSWQRRWCDQLTSISLYSHWHGHPIFYPFPILFFQFFFLLLLLLFLLFFGDSIIITWKIEEKWRYSSPVVDVKLATLRSPTKRFFFPLQVIQFLTLLACGFTLRPPDIWHCILL